MFAKKEVGYFDGILIYLFAIVGNLAVQLLLGIFIGVGGSLTGNSDFGSGNYFQLVCMIVLQLAFLSVPVLYCTTRKTIPVLAYPIRKPRPSLALAVLLPVVCMFGFLLPAALFENLLVSHGYKPSGIEFEGVGQTVLAVVVTVLIAPCVEELIFRGFLLSGLRKQFGPYLSAFMCAVAFSLMHMNPEQTVYQFCLGFVCAIAAVKSGTLLAPIIVHAGSNLLAVLAGYPINLFFEAVTSTVWSTALCTVGFAIIAVAAVFGICLLMRKFGYEQEPQEESAKEEKTSRKTGLLLYVGAIGICVLMWIFVFASAFVVA